MAEHPDDLPPAPPDDPAGEDLPLIDLETLLSRPPARRKRLIELGLLLAAAAVALAALWNAIAPGEPAVPALTPTPTPDPPLLLINSNVNYGTLTINGKKQSGKLPMLLAARSDTYTITLDAPPFRPQSCLFQLSRPYLSSDPACQGYAFSTPNWMVINGVSVAPTFELGISLSLNHLPPAEQRKVTALLTRRLTRRQNMAVPAGSYFAASLDAGKLNSRRAAASLQASAIVAPAPSRENDLVADCAGFICPGSVQMQAASPSSGHLWNIQANIAPRWRFHSASGALVSDTAFQPTNTINLSLSYHAAGSWSVASMRPLTGTLNDLFVDTFCSAGAFILGQLAGSSSSIAIGTSHDRGAAGCELALTVNAIDQGLYLWRFGALLAANAKAHTAHPELPIAPPAEIAAVENA